MKRFALCLIICVAVILLLNVTGRDVVSGDKATQYLYVKDKIGTIREAPKGKKINDLLQKTKVKVVEKKGGWAKVTVEGWIEVKSLTDDLSSIVDKKSAGNGFYYKNVSFKGGMMGNQALGEITNGSGRDYQLANFMLSVYDSNDRLFQGVYINISNIPNGVTKSFTTFLLDTSISEIVSYKIQFENGL